MNRIVPEIMLTLMLTSVLTLAFNIQPAKSELKTWIVDDDGPADFHTIQEAVNAANQGDTVYVNKGIYYENVVVNKTLSLVGESKENTIVDGGGDDVVLTVSQNDVTIKRFTLQNSSLYSIYLRYGVSRNNISENIMVCRWGAISSEGGYAYQTNTIADNTMISDFGIALMTGFGNIIARNNLTPFNPMKSYFENCIHIFSGSGNSVVDNVISHVGWEKGGIALWSSNDVVSRNIIEDYPEYGMMIFGSGSVIMGNKIRNPLAVTYQKGLSAGGSSYTLVGNTLENNLYGIWSPLMNNSLLHHNNFINNVNQLHLTEGFNNTWDDGYPSGGNYWGDYAGVDADGDGIGDTPYTIDTDNTDRYPLMAPFATFDAGMWNKVAYHVSVVSNSTISDFYCNPAEGPFIRFSVSGPSGTVGFCRVVIPKQLLWTENSWTVLIGSAPTTPTVTEDDNYTYLYFTYSPDSKPVVNIIGTNIVPEFPPFLLLPLFMIVSVLAVAFARRKQVLVD